MESRSVTLTNPSDVRRMFSGDMFLKCRVGGGDGGGGMRGLGDEVEDGGSLTSC